LNWTATARLALCALLALGAWSCEKRVPPTTTEAAETPVEPAALRVSFFQHALDEAGIDYTVPPAGKAILVNIPAFELIAFENGTPAFRSRVIVGTPWNPTPILETHVSAVRIRPSWRPTPAMVASGEYEDRRWPPGLNNPLGLLAVRLEPGLLVYLHDTNRRELFAETERALSHGCIRVQRWDELAAWVLDEDVSTIHAWTEGRRTFDQPAPPIPVTLGYFTVFPDDDGTLQYFPDVYGRETVLGAAPTPEPAGCPG